MFGLGYFGLFVAAVGRMLIGLCAFSVDNPLYMMFVTAALSVRDLCTLIAAIMESLVPIDGGILSLWELFHQHQAEPVADHAIHAPGPVVIEEDEAELDILEESVHLRPAVLDVTRNGDLSVIQEDNGEIEAPVDRDANRFVRVRARVQLNNRLTSRHRSECRGVCMVGNM